MPSRGETVNALFQLESLRGILTNFIKKDIFQLKLCNIIPLLWRKVKTWFADRTERLRRWNTAPSAAGSLQHPGEAGGNVAVERKDGYLFGEKVILGTKNMM